MELDSDREKGVFARLPITVTPLSVRLEAPTEVSREEGFEVHREGPDGERDYITIVPVGTEPGVFTHYRYTRQGSPLSLKAPEEAGRYELRYQSDRVTKRASGSRPIQVEQAVRPRRGINALEHTLVPALRTHRVE